MPVSSPPIRRPPPPPPPPPRRPPSSLHSSPSTPGKKTKSDDGNTDGKVFAERLHQNGTSPPSHPRRKHRQVNSNTKETDDSPLRSPLSIGSASRIESSPLKAAASLIQELDIEYTATMSAAADAAADAENARRNARTAQEIARRYQKRSYPTFKMDALEASFSASASIAGTSAGASSNYDLASCLKRSEIAARFQDTNPRSTGNRQKDSGLRGGEEKDSEKEATDGAEARPPPSPKPTVTRNKPSKAAVPNIRAGFHSPASFERIAQHHADDVLQLTLDLERTKQALKSEKKSCEHYKSRMESFQSKAASLEKRNQQIVEEHEVERQQSTTRISDLEQELEKSRLNLQAAEEDAQLALDLAKDSSEQKEQTEDLLKQARKEIEILKGQHDGQIQLATVETPKRSVHFADSDTSSDVAASVQTEETALALKLAEPARESGPPRSMIAAGRQLLLRRSMSPQDAVNRLEQTPTKSAERRQQLSQRLNERLNESINEDENIMLLSSSPSRTPLSPNRIGNASFAKGDTSACSTIVTNTATKKKLEEYHSAVKSLQISGKRLDLDGYWWRDHGKTMISQPPIQIDIMARQYCQNVEFKIDRQQKDINQLESLCGYLEKKLFLDEELDNIVS